MEENQVEKVKSEDIDLREVVQGAVIGEEGNGLLVEADQELYHVYEDRVEKA